MSSDLPVEGVLSLEEEEEPMPSSADETGDVDPESFDASVVRRAEGERRNEGDGGKERKGREKESESKECVGKRGNEEGKE